MWTGLAAYDSWLPAVRELITNGRPISFFSDFCEEAALRAAKVVLGEGVEYMSVPVFVNPFRHPARIVQTDNALPSYSNGFIFAFN